MRSWKSKVLYRQRLHISSLVFRISDLAKEKKESKNLSHSDVCNNVWWSMLLSKLLFMCLSTRMWMSLKICTLCNNHSNKECRKSCFSNISVMTVIGKMNQNRRTLVGIYKAIFIAVQKWFLGYYLQTPDPVKGDMVISSLGLNWEKTHLSDYLFVASCGGFIWW